MGKGLVDETSALCVGMIGSYGNRCANMAFAEADIVLALGSRLDLRQTGNRKSPLLADKLFIRVDIDAVELAESQLPRQIAINCDAAQFCNWFYEAGGRFAVDDEWMSRIDFLKAAYSQKEDVRRHVKNKLPYEVLELFSKWSSKDALLVADIGQNQMWAAQTVRCGERQGFFTSGGMAPMGYAIPAAAGAAFANPQRQIICFCGDGGMHISLQSLMLVSQYNLPVSIVVFNNHALGMITQFQSLYFGGNFAGTARSGGYEVPPLRALAAAYGLPYYRIASPSDADMRMLEGPAIVEVDMGEGETSVVPKLQFDHDLDDMTPPFEASAT
jgi:acetolactate synthase-1/2/3 large subunit